MLLRISALLACVGLGLCMDYGGRGVWDSPMATDYWVKRFGFMWGGGSSGMSGLKAMQIVSSKAENPEFEKSIYNPSGMYGMKAMDPSAPEYHYPGQDQPSAHQPQLSGARATSSQKEKSMVELSPMVVPMPGENKQMSFNRFMAVP